jgi:quinol monooxygenase YgiN
MILVIGRVQVELEHLDQAVASSQEHVRRSRTEPGCISHDVHRDLEEPGRLVFVERWSDHAALMQHFAVAESQAFVAALRQLATQPPTIEIFDATKLP